MRATVLGSQPTTLPSLFASSISSHDKQSCDDVNSTPVGRPSVLLRSSPSNLNDLRMAFVLHMSDGDKPRSSSNDAMTSPLKFGQFCSSQQEISTGVISK